jgi:Cyclin, N-terminal domain
MQHRKAKTFVFPEADSDKENRRLLTPKKPFKPSVLVLGKRLPLSKSIPVEMRKNEINSYTPDPLSSHKVSIATRQKMVQWMIEISATFNTKRSFFCGVKLMDKYFAEFSHTIFPKEVYIIGLTCVLVSSKLHDVKPLKIDNLISKTGSTKINSLNIIKYERILLKNLNFDVNLVCVHDFISLHCFELLLELPLVHTSELLGYYCQFMYGLLDYYESEVAVACICIALQRFGRKDLEDKDVYRLNLDRINLIIGLIAKGLESITKSEDCARLGRFLKADLLTKHKTGPVFKFYDKKIEKMQENLIRCMN